MHRLFPAARRRAHHTAGVVLLAAGWLVSGAGPVGAVSLDRAPRIASYRIDARLEPAQRRLSGRQVLTWRNSGERATAELPFHLYWNAWRNHRSTWMLESRLEKLGPRPSAVERLLGRTSGGRPRGPDEWGWIEIDRALWRGRGGDEGPVDLTATGRYRAADDGNRHDRTVWSIELPREVEPGESVEIELEWHARVPRTVARTGFRGDFFFLAHWFPQLGVFEADGWSCHQFHAATEFYADFGDYDVRLTVPEGWVVGATGKRVGEVESGDGEVTLHYRQEAVHGFAWTASPDFVERRERFAVDGLPPVDIRLLVQPEHLGQSARLAAATRAALELYGRWFGPYPYEHLTVVDPAWGSGAGGMEYPTLFTAGSRWLAPFGGGSPEGVTIHEAGHQFWYGVVANDESEHAWLDEGINTFATARAYAETYGDRTWLERYFAPPGTDLGGFFPVLFPDAGLDRATFGNRLHRFRRAPDWDRPSKPTWRYFPGTAARVSYDKTALWLATLERHLGWPTLREILATFYRRSAFRHPRPEELFAVAEEVSGRRLDDFFRQVWDDTVTFDYAVAHAESRRFPFEGWVEEEGEMVWVGPAPAGKGGPWRSEVVVRRLGEGVFPVDVLLVFADGSEVRHRWDGRAGWKLYVEEGPVPLERAVVDPERVLLLDLHPSNNGRLVDPRPEAPAARWALRWLVWMQELLRVLSFFA